jgi:hypothetical protein
MATTNTQDKAEDIVTEAESTTDPKAARKAAAEAIRAEILAKAPVAEASDADPELAALEAQMAAMKLQIAERRKAAEESATGPAHAEWLAKVHDPAKARLDKAEAEFKAAKEAYQIAMLANPRKTIRQSSGGSVDRNGASEETVTTKFSFTVPTTLAEKFAGHKKIRTGGTNGPRTIMHVDITSRARDARYYANKMVKDAGVALTETSDWM